MKQQVQTLIQQHKFYKQEVEELLKELNNFDADKMNKEEFEQLIIAKEKAELENGLRNSFIADLENLL